MNLENARYAIFDFETTGLSPYSGDAICEIGAILFTPGSKKIKTYQQLVDPLRPISYGAFRVNGISQEMVSGEPTIDKALPQFMKFIKGSVLVAYNAGFDLGFLEAALGDEKSVLGEYYIIDALRLARKFFPGLRRYSLGSVAVSLGVSKAQEHRALADCEMTLSVFRHELEFLRAEGVTSIEGIAAHAGAGKPAPLMVRDWRLDRIEAAIRDQKKLSIIYRSSWNNELSKRIISPKSILPGYDRSYVVAHCHLRNAARNFRLDGIVEIEEHEL